MWCHDSIMWCHHDSIMWGHHDSIMWGHDSIMWGHHDSIMWGHHDSIMWGHHDSIMWCHDSLMWGYDCIMWCDDSIMWGHHESWNINVVLTGVIFIGAQGYEDHEKNGHSKIDPWKVVVWKISLQRLVTTIRSWTNYRCISVIKYPLKCATHVLLVWYIYNIGMVFWRFTQYHVIHTSNVIHAYNTCKMHMFDMYYRCIAYICITCVELYE